jgi:hypothetical protein
MSGPNDYEKEDSKNDTGASWSEQKAAWHDARADYKETYGDLNPSANPSGAEAAFGPVAGQNEASDDD